MGEELKLKRIINNTELIVVDDKKANDIVADLNVIYKFKESFPIEDDEVYIKAQYKFSKIGVYVIDLNLGKSESQGIKVIEKIRNRYKFACIIVYSAHTNDGIIKKKCSDAGANFFVQVGGKSEEEALMIVKYVEKYFNEFDQYFNERNQFNIKLNELIDEVINTEKKTYDCKVLNFDETRVFLRVKDAMGKQSDRWFNKRRVDCSVNMKIAQCYKMIDVIKKCGKSELSFERVEMDLFDSGDIEELKDNVVNLFKGLEKQ